MKHKNPSCRWDFLQWLHSAFSGPIKLQAAGVTYRLNPSDLEYPEFYF